MDERVRACVEIQAYIPHSTNIFPRRYDPTIEDSYSVTRIIDGRQFFLNLTDTAGQEEYRSLFGAATLTLADAFLLVYDITSPSSLEALGHFAQLIDIETEQRLDRGGVPPIKIVVGNKCDLKENRRVRAQEGMEWARRHGCGFMETSARECVNVEETFARTPSLHYQLQALLLADNRV